MTVEVLVPPVGGYSEVKPKPPGYVGWLDVLMGFPSHEDESPLWLFHLEIIGLMKRTFWFKICICSALVLISELFSRSTRICSSNLSQSQC